jgi:hypothetical protein
MMWRALPLALVLLWLMVASAAADPVKHPNARTYTLTCTTSGGEITFDVVGTGASGHDLGSNSNAVLLAGTTTTFVNGVQTNQDMFDHPGVGTKTVQCAARTEFLDDDGNTVVIEITDALVHLTPAR